MNIAALVMLVLVLVIMILRKKWQWPVFHYIFFCRVPIICGLLLLGLAPIAIWVAKDFLGNLLILSNRWGFFAVALVTVIAGNMVLQTTMFIIQQAPVRFGVDPVVWKPKPRILAWLAGIPEAWVRCIGSTLLALPLSFFVGWYSWPEYDHGWIMVLFSIAGILVGLGLLLLANLVFLPQKVMPEKGPSIGEKNGCQDQDSETLEKTWASLLFKGYTDEDAASKKFYQHRHSRLALTAASLIAIFFLGALLEPGEVLLPALFFVVFITLVYGYVFSAFAFFGDAFRIPVLMIVFWGTILLSWLQDTRHYYQVFHFTEQQQAHPAQTPSEKEMVPAASQEKMDRSQAIKLEEELLAALKKRLERQGDEKKLVAMAVTGGGIQAAGWTAQVLTGLYEDPCFGPDFIGATGMISSVSGGSVGSMFFLDRLEELEQKSNKQGIDETIKVIRENAMGNSLPDVAWSLAYQDLLRLFGVNWLVSKQEGGRGWALEESFRLRLENKDAGMRSHWLNAVRKGDLPLPVFNATLVESGDRLLISPFVHPEAARAQSMARIYPDLDLKVATAARLSATFPFVSPLASPIDPEGRRVEPKWHVADGGYFDTYGMFTLVEWLNTVVMPNATELGLKKVIILQINAFPETKPKEEGLGGWEAAVVGPVDALINVRVSTQEARNMIELELLDRSWKGKGAEISNFDLRYKLESTAGKTKPQPDPPYSWKLSRQEKNRIRAAWDAWLGSDQKCQLWKAWMGNSPCQPCKDDMGQSTKLEQTQPQIDNPQQ